MIPSFNFHFSLMLFALLLQTSLSNLRIQQQQKKKISLIANEVSAPVVENIKLTQIIGENKARLTGVVKYQDKDKELYLYCDYDKDGAASQYITKFKIKVGEYHLSELVTVSENANDKYCVWVSTSPFSTSTSTFDTRFGDAKSNVVSVTVTFPDPTLTINFPVSTQYPRNKKIHLTGTADCDGSMTMKFTVDGQVVPVTAIINTGDVDYDFEIPEHISNNEEHTLKVFAVDKRGTPTKENNVFKFTVLNDIPKIKDVVLDMLEVVAGEKIVITGKVLDQDKGTIKVRAYYENVKSNEVVVESDGTEQSFRLEITTEDVTSQKSFNISIESDDGTDKFVYYPKPQIVVKPAIKPTKTAEPEVDLKSTTKTKLKTGEAKENDQKKKKLYIIIGAVAGSLVVIAIIIAVVVIVVKKKNPPPEDGGYQRDEHINP